MNKIRFVLICIVLLISINSLWSQTVAKWNTSMGEFEVMMREDLVPITVGNFVDLTILPIPIFMIILYFIA